MSRFWFLISAALVLSTLVLGCSGGVEKAVEPGLQTLAEEGITPEEHGAMGCLGFWQVSIDQETGRCDVVDLRSSELMLNVLGFLEPPVLEGMSINFDTLTIDEAHKIIEVDVILTHPITDAMFMGFDVRGVVFGPKVINADGLTIVPGPEFFKDVPFGYQDGLLGVPNSTAHYKGLAGYKYFCDGLYKEESLATFMSTQANVDKRGVFSQGPKKNTRHYVLDWTNATHDFFVFNYAVYANYDWPVGSAPYDASDFDINKANSAEAFCCKVTELENSLYYAGGGGGGGGRISLMVEAWDWQTNINNVSIEAPGVITKQTLTTPSGPGSTNKSFIYEFIDVPGTPTATGDLDILITAADPVTFGQAWFMGLLPPSNAKYNQKVYNSFIYTTWVPTCPFPVVYSTEPDHGWVDQNPCVVRVNCSFVDGDSLAVRLERLGQADILGTILDKNETEEWILCKFDLTGANWNGKWDVVVTNGCSTDGKLTNYFWIKTCVADKDCPSGYVSSTMPFTPYIYEPDHGGHVSTRAAYPPYVIICGQDSIPPEGEKFRAITTDLSTIAYSSKPIHDAYYFPTTFAIDSKDRLYYNSLFDLKRIEYVDFTTTGFGTMDNLKGTLPDPWSSWRITVDENDNPIVLAYRTSPDELGIFHWNGADFGSAITVDSQVLSDNGDTYYYMADFDYNPGMGHYLITNRYRWSGGSYLGSPTIYAIDSNGDIAWSDTQVWAGLTGNMWSVGVYVDKDDPECHMLLSCGSYFFSGTPYRHYFARYNLGYGEKTTDSDTSNDYLQIFQYYDSAQGTVAKDGSNYYFYTCVQSYYYLGRIQIPQW